MRKIKKAFIFIVSLFWCFLILSCNSDNQTYYQLTYNPNGADSGSVPVSVEFIPGDTLTASDNTGSLSRAGYIFSGWSTDSDSYWVTYKPGDSIYTYYDDMDLYAFWEEVPTYCVYYYPNNASGGSVPSDDNTYYEGDIVTVLGNTDDLYRTGYTFIGWNTQSDGNGTDYIEGDQFKMETDWVYLYAMWTSAPTYNVIYHADDAESGSVPIDSKNYLEDASVAVKSNTGGLSRNGFALTGWNTDEYGNGTEYSIGQKFIMGTEDVDLYAVWSPTYTVTYHADDADSGSVPVNNNRYVDNIQVTVSDNTGNLERAGYVFSCWNTLENGNGTDYAAGSKITIQSSDADLYAQWTPAYTVKYHADDANSGSVPVDSNSYLEGATVTVLGNTGNLQRTGYSFNGWNTNNEGNGIDYLPDEQFEINTQDIELYAQWKLPTGTVTITNPEAPTFSLNPTSLTLNTGGGVTEQTVSVTLGSGITVSSYIWKVNGTTQSTDSIISLDTETNPDWFITGQNTLTLIIVIDDMPYSDSFIFTVEQY